jgi:hypothetical protein
MIEQIIQNIVLILCALLSGGVGLRLYDRFVKMKKKQNAEEFYNDTKEIIDTIDDLVLDPAIDRVLIFRGGNGGSIPKLGKDYFVKAVFEAHKQHPVVSSLKTFAGVIPDSHYISILLNIMEKKKESIEVQQLPNSLLKKIYMSENITFSDIHILCQTEEYIFFCSVSTKQNINFNGDILVQLKIDNAISKLKKMFVKHYIKSFFNV